MMPLGGLLDEKLSAADPRTVTDWELELPLASVAVKVRVVFRALLTIAEKVPVEELKVGELNEGEIDQVIGLVPPVALGLMVAVWPTVR